MEYVGEESEGATAFILCCECGVQIEPNPANMCVACLRSQVDITEGIPKQAVLYFCKSCERYLQPPNSWINASLETPELLSVCLKRIKGLQKVHLVDAGFIWTEPHSKRLKVKLTIQKEVNNGAILQQVFVVEYVVNGQMCDDCHRVEAKDFWRALVQIRQKTDHKKTLFYLEQTILKYKAHENCSNIKVVHGGLDFFYGEKNNARRLVDFLQSAVPCKYQVAQELISHDIHNNTFNYKFTFSVEIVPICKDNVVCLPPKLAHQLGNMSQICICERVTGSLHLIDPSTLQVAEVTRDVFWRTPFQSLCHPKQMQEFIVMQSDPIREKDKRKVAGAGQISQKHVLSDVWVVRAAELGTSGQQYYCRSHLGHLLQPGDSVMGLDLRTANVNNTDLEKMKTEKVPDVVLVKKVYCETSRRIQKRKWKLQRIDLSAQETNNDKRDYNEFLEDLEEDAEYRQNVNIYKDAAKIPVEAVDGGEYPSDDEGLPQISLQEMLEDLSISHDATGEEGAPMID